MHTIKTPKATSRSLMKNSTFTAYGSSIQRKKVDYNSKLTYVSPAATIEDIKKNIKQVIRVNMDLKGKIEAQDERTIKKREIIAELDYET